MRGFGYNSIPPKFGFGCCTLTASGSILNWILSKDQLLFGFWPRACTRIVSIPFISNLMVISLSLIHLSPINDLCNSANRICKFKIIHVSDVCYNNYSIFHTHSCCNTFGIIFFHKSFLMFSFQIRENDKEQKFFASFIIFVFIKCIKFQFKVD